MTDTPKPDNAPSAPPEPGIQARDAFRWVPIRALAARHRHRILRHLLGLNDADRYLRFGSIASDAQIAHYVDLIDFEQDEVFGIFNRRLDLLAAAHLAYGQSVPGPARTDDAGRSAEFGVSVMEHARGRGYGSHLFDRAVLHARNRGIERLVVHALTENKAMLAIARKAGAFVVRDGSESQAELQLPPDDVGSHVGQMVHQAVGEIDFRLKAQAHAVGHVLSRISEVGAQVMQMGEAPPAEAASPVPDESAASVAPAQDVPTRKPSSYTH